MWYEYMYNGFIIPKEFKTKLEAIYILLIRMPLIITWRNVLKNNNPWPLCLIIFKKYREFHNQDFCYKRSVEIIYVYETSVRSIFKFVSPIFKTFYVNLYVETTHTVLQMCTYFDSSLLIILESNFSTHSDAKIKKIH